MYSGPTNDLSDVYDTQLKPKFVYALKQEQIDIIKILLMQHWYATGKILTQLNSIDIKLAEFFRQVSLRFADKP